jgi:hypothetical protein
MIDARIRAEPERSIGLSRERVREELDVDGETLLKGAEKREGRFFVAQMPENVRTRKSSTTCTATSAEAEGDEEPYR